MTDLEYFLAFSTSDADNAICTLGPKDANGERKSLIFAYSDPDEVHSIVMDQVPPGHDVYFTPASFKKGSIKHAKSRNKSNLLELPGVWLDIDCKAPGKKKYQYETQAEAVEAVTDFQLDHNLPTPFIIYSGWGVHVYWFFDDLVDISKWQPVADRLKQLCIESGLQIDAGITTDALRMMRLPGTENWRDRNNPVMSEIVQTGDECAYDKLCELLGVGTAPAPAPAPKVEVDTDDLFSGLEWSGSVQDLMPPKTYATVEPNQVFEHCAVARLVRDEPNEILYPVWRAVMSNLIDTEGGRDLCHEVSSGHDNYREDETDTLLDGLQGPIGCARIADDMQDVCKGCQYHGKDSQPINVYRFAPRELTTTKPEPVAQGWDTEEIEKAQSIINWDRDFDPVHPADVELPQELELPHGFFYDGPKIVWQPKGTGDKKPDPVPVFHREFKIKAAGRHIVSASADGYDFEYGFRAAMRGADGKWSEMDLSYSDVVNMGNLTKHFSGKLGYLLTTDAERNSAQRFLKARLNQYGSKMDGLQRIFPSLGWYEDDDEKPLFVLNDLAMYVDKPRPVILRESPFRGVEGEMLKGSIETWRDEQAKVFSLPGTDRVALLTLTAWGAPWMYWTNLSASAVVIAQSTESGTGKSLATKSAASAYGPVQAKVGLWHVHNATTNSDLDRMSNIRNLPVYIDEFRPVGNLRREGELESFLLKLANGAARSRLVQAADKSFKQQHGEEFSTITTLTTNHPIHDELTRENGTDMGTLERLIHIYCEPPRDSIKAKQVAYAETLKHHHGLAGYYYIDYITRHFTEARAFIQKEIARLEAAWQPDDAARIRFSTLATMLAGGRLAVKAGVCGLDMDRLEATAKAVFEENTEQVITLRDDEASWISAIIRRNMNSIVRYDRKGKGSKLMTNTDHLHTLIGKYYAADKELYLDLSFARTDLKLNSRLGWQHVEKYLKAHDISNCMRSKVNLIIGRDETSTNCIRLDLRKVPGYNPDEEIRDGEGADESKPVKRSSKAQG